MKLKGIRIKKFRIRDFILSRFDTKQGVAELSTRVKERIYSTGELNVKLYTDKYIYIYILVFVNNYYMELLFVTSFVRYFDDKR